MENSRRFCKFAARFPAFGLSGGSAGSGNGPDDGLAVSGVGTVRPGVGLVAEAFPADPPISGFGREGKVSSDGFSGDGGAVSGYTPRIRTAGRGKGGRTCGSVRASQRRIMGFVVCIVLMCSVLCFVSGGGETGFCLHIILFWEDSIQFGTGENLPLFYKNQPLCVTRTTRF